jgi:ribosomal protein S18 acetylase RimI-like enzyme
MIRLYQPADEAQVVALWQACELTRPWNDPRKDIARKLALQPELFAVAECEGLLAGSVMVGYEGHRGWINYLAVSPAHRRAGLGRALMAWAEARLHERGCPKINLQVRSGNSSVLAFYDALGYGRDDVVGLGKRLVHDD